MCGGQHKVFVHQVLFRMRHICMEEAVILFEMINSNISKWVLHSPVTTCASLHFRLVLPLPAVCGSDTFFWSYLPKFFCHKSHAVAFGPGPFVFGGLHVEPSQDGSQEVNWVSRDIKKIFCNQWQSHISTVYYTILYYTLYFLPYCIHFAILSLLMGWLLAQLYI